MTLADVVQKAPEVIAELAAVSLAIGAFGTALEHAGEVLKLHVLVVVGQRLEALFGDLPKMLRGSRYSNIANG